jgi:hypothetical protein
MTSSVFHPLTRNGQFPKDKEARKSNIAIALSKDPVAHGIRVAGMEGSNEVYEVDIDDLIYNFHNYRFFMERATIERQMSSSFYTDEEHRFDAARITEEKIWNQDEKANEETIRSLLEDKQLEPAVCEGSGVVISGNRRLTLLHQIKRRREAGYYKNESISASRFEELAKMRVIVVKQEMTVAEIEQAETKLQHNNPAKLEYDRIAKYFIVKNLSTNLGMSNHEIYENNKTMQSLNGPTDVDKFVRVANLMEDYLKVFKMPGMYTQLTGMEDPMRRLDDDLKKIRERKNKRVGNVDLMILEYRTIFFTALRSAQGSGKKGGLKEKWYRDMFKAFDTESVSWKTLGAEVKESIATVTAPEKIDDHTIKEHVQKWHEGHGDGIAETISEVIDEVRDYNKFNDRPEKLLTRARDDLEKFDGMITGPDSQVYLDGIENPTELIDEIRKKVNSILNHLPVE